MKSPMVSNQPYITNKEGYSEMQVLRSGAGYYVGTTYTGPDGFVEPGSRDSGYFATHDEAQKYLDMVATVANPQEYLRVAP